MAFLIPLGFLLFGTAATAAATVYLVIEGMKVLIKDK